MKNFIGYTVGLECNGLGRVGSMIKVEFTRISTDSVRLSAVSGRNLEKIGVHKTVTTEEFENRPGNNIAQARWALNILGFSLMAEDTVGK